MRHAPIPQPSGLRILDAIKMINIILLDWRVFNKGSHSFDEIPQCFSFGEPSLTFEFFTTTFTEFRITSKFSIAFWACLLSRSSALFTEFRICRYACVTFWTFDLIARRNVFTAFLAEFRIFSNQCATVWAFDFYLSLWFCALCGAAFAIINENNAIVPINNDPLFRLWVVCIPFCMVGNVSHLI